MIFIRPILFSFLLTCLGLTWVWAEDSPALDDDSRPPTKTERRTRFLQTTLTGVGVVTVWGVLQWDYFSQTPNAQSEGWFGRDTENGGADKLGHMYTTYVLSHGLSALYRHWNFKQEDAALYGALSSFTIMGYMELGDSFSDFGFSYEDMIANTAGAVLGYVLYKYDNLSDKLDFRWQPGFEPNKTDFSTDYENSKFLLALKLNGFDWAKQTPWRHVEFHLGYYTRGFAEQEIDRERKIYVGIGINLTDLFRRHGWKKTATFLRYVQIPYTSINAEHSFD
jgi:uncharacterized protein YfiM (DUF2279 family)